MSFVCEEWGEEGMIVCRPKIPLLCFLRCSLFGGILAIEVGDKFWGVFQMLHGFPCTVTRGESLPLDYVVEFAPSALSVDFLDFFGFVLLFSIDKVRWRSGKVQAV